MNFLTSIFDFDKFKSLFLYNSHEPMIFNSSFFMFLFFGFVFVYFTLQKTTTIRLVFVTVFSYYFYYKSSGTYFFLLAVVTLSDFILARLISKVKKKNVKKMFVAMSLFVGLGLLGYFKYFNFFGVTFYSIIGKNFQLADIFLPVGISFFTFQSLSYTIDVYRGNIKPLENLLDYAFYVSFFPQLVAGPIVRARDFIPQIRKPLCVTNQMIGQGLFFIICGLFKKAVISDYIGVNFVDRIFDNPSLYSGIENLFGVYGYGLQIYCDFSGYSDMAIGLALLLGYHFNINFNSPYKSASVTEFWHRWHISLSTWLRDYLYISLGGNRKGKIRTYVNLMITMLLGGLWHGANWNFIIWGALHGVALAAHKFFRNAMKRGKDFVRSRFSVWRILGIIVTFHFVMFAWIFFRNSSFENSYQMLERIFSDFQPQIFFQMLGGYKFVMFFIALGYILHFSPSEIGNMFRKILVKSPLVVKAIIVIGLIYFVAQIKSSDIQPFIYFQF